MDGISAVTARIGEIRALLHPAPAADALARAVVPAEAEPLSVAALQAKYSNGHVPAEALAPIGDRGHRLAAPAAAASTT